MRGSANSFTRVYGKRRVVKSAQQAISYVDFVVKIAVGKFQTAGDGGKYARSDCFQVLIEFTEDLWSRGQLRRPYVLGQSRQSAKLRCICMGLVSSQAYLLT